MKTVLITGCSSGLGLSLAKKFIQGGYNVIATMRTPQPIDGLVENENLLIAKLDVEDSHSISSALRIGLKKFGHIDVVINNAGYGQYGIVEGIKLDKVRANFEVNLFGVINVIQQTTPIFRKQGGGIFVNISSCGGIFGLPMSSIYLSTKFALEGFSESVSYELASQNIIVKIVEPGGIQTPFHRRSANEHSGNSGIQDYDDFIKATDNAMMNLVKGGIATADQVAEDIFLATNDGTNRLRYCFSYGVEHLVEARRQHDDKSYEEIMRTYFPVI